MSGFIVFVGIVAGLVFLFRYMRKRELDAFKGEDINALKDFTPAKAAPDTPPVIDVAELRAKYADLPETVRATEQIVYAARGPVLDEIHRTVLAVLDDLLAERFRVFVQMPLTDFVRVEEGSTTLIGKQVSFLVCYRNTMAVAFGVMFRGAGSIEVDRHSMVAEVFRQMEWPLVSLPLVSGLSPAEVEDGVADALTRLKR